MATYEVPLSLVTLEDDSNVMLMVEVEVPGQPLKMVLDTGASHTCMDRDCVKRFKVQAPSSDHAVMGIGGRRLSNFFCSLPTFRIGGLLLRDYQVVAVRMHPVNRMLKKLGKTPLGGLLGSDFLRKYHAVISYDTAMLRLRDEEPECEGECM